MKPLLLLLALALAGCSDNASPTYLAANEGTVSRATDNGPSVYGRYTVEVVVPNRRGFYERGFAFRTNESFAAGDKVVITHAK